MWVSVHVIGLIHWLRGLEASAEIRFFNCILDAQYHLQFLNAFQINPCARIYSQRNLYIRNTPPSSFSIQNSHSKNWTQRNLLIKRNRTNCLRGNLSVLRLKPTRTSTSPPWGVLANLHHYHFTNLKSTFACLQTSYSSQKETPVASSLQASAALYMVPY